MFDIIKGAFGKGIVVNHHYYPIKHHYIPQFLIRPFCNEHGTLLYYDLKTHKTTERKPEEIFMERYLYKDVVNNPDDPVLLEKEFSKLESEAARIIKKLSNEDDVVILCEEEEKLRIFLAIMGLRSKRALDQFWDEDSFDYYVKYQQNGDFSDFWKRNLEGILKCSSIKEIINSPEIDQPIKLFMFRDLVGLTGIYTMLVERRGNEDFLLSDCYPLVIEGSSENGLKFQEYMIFPISPKRAIMLVANGIQYVSKAASGFDGEFFKRPILSRDGKNLRIRINKIYEKDVHWINDLILDNACEGVVIQSENTRFLQRSDQTWNR